MSALSLSQQPTVCSIYQNNTWTIRPLVNETIDPAYYIEDCRISNTFGSCWHEDRTLMLSNDGLGWIFKVHRYHNGTNSIQKLHLNLLLGSLHILYAFQPIVRCYVGAHTNKVYSKYVGLSKWLSIMVIRVVEFSREG